ncbi:MAG: prolyl-tRNA synthetase associated domain-containing protein [Gemmatimonadetes bacterium]|nr:prolyl-tRNA synthetase associated domain-containing protein [Gemmatimonadota bacterium]
MNSRSDARLIDDSPPAGPDDLFARLDELGISYDNVTHPPVFTVQEARTLRGTLPGAHSKNLFLRDKKEKHWLVSCLSNRTVDLAWLAHELGTKRLTFCSNRRLMAYLGITPGSVSPFAVLNDVTGIVNVALDQEMLEQEPLNFHPLDNGQTTSISAAGLRLFLEDVQHPPRLLRFPDEELPW